MKKTACLVISLFLILCLSSCNDVYEETLISDIREYNEIWTLPEHRVAETSLLFPNNVAENQCASFVGKHTTYHLLGTGWQISLEVIYDDTSFSEEIDRLNNLCANSAICGASQYFDNPAYATVWNWNSCFEYAVIDEKEKTICYIYLQLIQKNDLIIGENYIPKGYEMQLTDSYSYSVYEK